MDDWQDAVDELLDGIIDESVLPPPPPGSFTLADYQARLEKRGIAVPASTAERHLHAQCKHGHLRTDKFRIDGRPRRVYWQRPEAEG